MGYILGVDGGNTKTDYYLYNTSLCNTNLCCTNQGLIGMYRGGTCSHEGLKDSFAGTYRVMKQVLDEFLPQYGLKVSDIEAACFGLAGDDFPSQQKKLDEVMVRLGFKNFKVVNDSMLGIKAGTTNGVGVCSINGTGTVAGGIGLDGKTIQVGGIGEVVGDEAGGRFIARKVIRAAFDEVMRCGIKTSLTPIVFNLLNLEKPELLMESIAEVYLTGKVDYNILTIACFEEANKQDEASLTILKTMADNLARSASGAVLHLNLPPHPEIVLAGSVYVKGSCPVLIDEFKKKVKEYTKKDCDIKVLTVPPATGAIIWALELYQGSYPTLNVRQSIIEEVKKALEDQK